MRLSKPHLENFHFFIFWGAPLPGGTSVQMLDFWITRAEDNLWSSRLHRMNPQGIPRDLFHFLRDSNVQISSSEAPKGLKSQFTFCQTDVKKPMRQELLFEQELHRSHFSTSHISQFLSHCTPFRTSEDCGCDFDNFHTFFNFLGSLPPGGTWFRCSTSGLLELRAISGALDCTK